MPKRTVDLFAGPGGWSESARSLGILEIGVEHDASACATRAAAGHLTVRADVAQYPPERIGHVEGLIASPPCPTFSAAGKGEGIGQLPELHRAVRACVTGWVAPEVVWSDPRTGLVLEPLRWAHATVPTWIALEQVPPVLPVWESMATVLRGWGYSVWCGILNAADYGVPQTRRRAILIAHRTRPVTAPEPTHAREPGVSLFAQRLPWVSMADALGWGMGDRPGYTITGGGTESGGAEPWGGGARQQYQLHTNRGQDEHGNRQTVATSAPALSTKAGGQWAFERPATTIGGDPRISPPNHHEDGSQSKGAIPTSDIAPWAYERPCTTIVGSFRPDIAAAPGWRGPGDGPRQNAEGSIKLTLRDALILQSFRPDYPVQGTKTKQFEQVGNAVPPLLARAVLGELANV